MQLVVGHSTQAEVVRVHDGASCRRRACHGRYARRGGSVDTAPPPEQHHPPPKQHHQPPEQHHRPRRVAEVAAAAARYCGAPQPAILARGNGRHALVCVRRDVEPVARRRSLAWRGGRGHHRILHHRRRWRGPRPGQSGAQGARRDPFVGEEGARAPGQVVGRGARRGRAHAATFQERRRADALCLVHRRVRAKKDAAGAHRRGPDDERRPRARRRHRARGTAGPRRLRHVAAQPVAATGGAARGGARLRSRPRR